MSLYIRPLVIAARERTVGAIRGGRTPVPVLTVLGVLQESDFGLSKPWFPQCG